jgi:DNA modification methylase
VSDQDSPDDRAHYLFKLRGNIALDGDLALARMELTSFFPDGVDEVGRAAELAREFPQLAGLKGFSALDSYVRAEGTQALRARGPLPLLPDLIRRLSFVQRVYCLTRSASATQDWLARLEPGIQAVTAYQACGDDALVQAVPHYALFELSDVVARRSSGPREVKRNLDELLAALVGAEAGRARGEGARGALSARSTTSHLSHGIHYYKAKFFPRLVRSVLSTCARRLGDGPCRVLDPFVGSGTTLLEAAILGLPSTGLDIDPLSVLISRTKLDIWRMDSGQLAEEVERVTELLDHGNLSRPANPRMMGEAIPFPDWLLKNRKMTAEMAWQLSEEIRTLQAASAACVPQVRPLFRVLMSDAIARRVRMRFLGTGVGRFSLSFGRSSAPEIFARSLARSVKTASALEWLRETVSLHLASAQVIEGDARYVPGRPGYYDILLTSPPYLPASSGRESYARARAPSLIALGLKDRRGVDHLADDSVGSMDGREIDWGELTDDQRQLVDWLGADPLREIKARPTARYFLDMRRALSEMARVLRPEGLAVIVTGKQSTFYRFATREPLYTVPSAEFLAEEGERAGLLVDALYDVELKKANRNARPRSLDDYFETLIVLRKPG